MREETKKRLERVIWIERLKIASVGLGVAVVIAAAFTYQSYDMQETKTNVAGIVTAIDPLIASQNAAGGETLHVKLDDGRAVNVVALKTRQLKTGDHIEVTEHHHATGRVTHSLK